MTFFTLLLLAQLGASGDEIGAGAFVPHGEQQASRAAAPLTLAAAVSRARTESARRRAAALVAEAAREAVTASGRLPNPVVELRSENWAPGGGARSPELDVFAIVTQPLELGGKRGLRRELAASERDVALGALQSVERHLIVATVRAYVSALRARALVEALTSHRDGLARLIETVSRQVGEGYTAEADLLKFRTEAARVHGDVARAQLELDRSLAVLSVTINAAEPILATQLIEPAPLPPPMANPDEITQRVARHPDVIAATAVVDRARQLTAVERARGFPDPAISAGYKRTAGFNTAVIGVIVAMPLFERNRAGVVRSLGAERGAVAERDAVIQQLTIEAAALVRAAHTMSERATAASAELLEPAAGVRRAALAAFREGSADVLRVIDAERVYADVQRAAIDLRLDALLATLEARFALGEETIP